MVKPKQGEASLKTNSHFPMLPTAGGLQMMPTVKAPFTVSVCTNALTLDTEPLMRLGFPVKPFGLNRHRTS